MKEEEIYISVFKGSVVEADQVHDYLEQNNIGSLVRNHMQENLSAGWMMSEADFAAEVFVSREDQKNAGTHIRNMFHEGMAEDPLVEEAKDVKENKEIRNTTGGER